MLSVPVALSLLLSAPFQVPTVATVARDLRRGDTGQLASQVKTWLGDRALATGTVRQDGLLAFWAVESATAKSVRVVDALGASPLPLGKLP